MNNLSEPLNFIYQYYPRNISYDSAAYASSPEYAARLRCAHTWAEQKDTHMQLLNKVNGIFEGYHVQDWTDFAEFYSCELQILLHKGQPILDHGLELMAALGNRRMDLTIFISILSPYFCLGIEKTEGNPETQSYHFSPAAFAALTPDIQSKIEALRLFFAEIGRKELTPDLQKVVVPDVETELIPFGLATMFDCLFGDLTSSFEE